MAVDERGRLELADAAKRALGDDAGITLMELLPPVGWADVATKHDLMVLRGDLDVVREDLHLLRGEVNDVRGEVNNLRGEVNNLRGEVNNLRGEVNDLRGEVNDLRGEFGELRGDFDDLRNEFKDLRRDVDVGLERGFRQMLVTFTSLMVGGFLVAIIAIVGTALVR